MIVNKHTKAMQDRSDCDYNWMGEDWIYVQTGTELANKIGENAPFIDLIFDENGNLIDVKPTSEGALIHFNETKKLKIAESKLSLAKWLETHPMLYSDGKYYSVTEEKQSLLNSNLASYERAQATGIPYPLKWNSTGSECVEWDYTDLLTLSLTIAAYVAPKVSKQQAIEVAINACETIEELEEIVINYDEN